MKHPARRNEARRKQPPSPNSEHIAQEPGLGSSERLTILCCRIVTTGDADAQQARIRPETLHALRARIDEILLRFHGYVVQEQAQRLWACFRDVHDGHDGARRAVLASVELAVAPAGVRSRQQTKPPPEIAVCIGVHSGRIALGAAGTVDEQGGVELDEITRLASQLADEASAGGVVASEATYREAQAHFQFRELGVGGRSGVAELTRLYEALDPPGERSGPSSAALPALTPLCGRQPELDFLVRCWQHAARGQSPVAVITGEAGIGKTRLARALGDSLALEPHELLECACSDLLASTSLHPIIELIEERLQIGRDHKPEHKLERLRAELLSSSLDPGSALPLLAAVLGIEGAPRAVHASAASARRATLEALRAWLGSLVARRPTLLLVEDLQWADASTVELLGLLVDSAPLPGLMLLLTHRPEFALPWASTRLWELVLTPLQARDSARVVVSVARTRTIDDSTVRKVIEKAAGVPLYLEEITKAWLEASGEREAGPEAASDSLVRRLQARGPERATLQLGAVLGQKFAFELLSAVSERGPSDLRADLDALLVSGLLQRAPGTEEAYAFRHALLQAAAYESTPEDTRRAYHRRTAETILARFPELAKAQPELVARQFGRAGLPDSAVEHWALAGSAARARCAYGESVRAYSGALSALCELPASEARDRREIELRTARGVALIAVQGYASPEVEANYGRALELCEQQSDASFGVVYGIWCVFLVRCDAQPAERLARSFLRIAESDPDPLARFCAKATLGTHARFSGDYRTAQRYLDDAAAFYDLEHGAEQLAQAETAQGYDGFLFPWVYGASCRISRGFPEQGWALGLRAREFAESTRHPYALAMTFGFLSNWAADVRGEFALARQWAARERALGIEHGFAFWTAMSGVHAGFADAQFGNVQVGIAQIDAGIRQLERLGGLGPVLHGMQFLADALLLASEAQRALRVSDDILQHARGRLAGIYEPRAMLTRGCALLALGDTRAAEEQLRAAIRLSHEQDARMYELRACVELAKLLREQGRGSEARASLEPIYTWFTEGFELPDLRAAREVLATL